MNTQGHICSLIKSEMMSEKNTGTNPTVQRLLPHLLSQSVADRFAGVGWRLLQLLVTGQHQGSSPNLLRSAAVADAVDSLLGVLLILLPALWVSRMLLQLTACPAA